MIMAVLVWIVYRFVLWIRHDVMGIEKVEEEKVQPKIVSKHTKSDYQKIKPSLKQTLKDKDSMNHHQKDKEMIISELNFNDEYDRESDDP